MGSILSGTAESEAAAVGESVQEVAVATKSAAQLGAEGEAAVRGAGFRSLMSSQEAARYNSFWEGLAEGRAPVQSSPYDIIGKYDAEGGLRGATTYDQFGNRAYQYEFGSVRHGEGYHFYDNSASSGVGNGVRSDHIPF